MEIKLPRWGFYLKELTLNHSWKNYKAAYALGYNFDFFETTQFTSILFLLQQPACTKILISVRAP